jgi:predicted Zn-dependent peptidase
MINFEEFSLDNGLKVIVHEDHSLPIAVLNILYNVGSRDESEDKTGFAHLFEHLMFGGSANIKSFDEPLQKVGGENNAFTSPDITNYYISIPAANLETAFWLESDRMFSLSFEEKVLEIQRKVVIEEFKQRYLNQPYGDVWLKLRPLAYKTHPYKWATIGKDISHIETASLEDVTSFFNKFYIPNNATMVVAGDVNAGEVIKLADKWFGDIPDGKRYIRQLPMEPAQLELRRQEIEANVPLDAIYMAFHMPGRFDNDYYTADLISDILGKGKTSRLYQRLVKDKNIFTSINAYVTGSVDPGLLVISGKIKNSITPEFAEHEINDIIEEFMDKGTSMQELQKVKNQAYTSLAFQDVELLNRAMNLAYFSNMGDPNLVNREKSRIESVSIDNMLSVGRKILKKSNRNVLNYNSRK